MVNHVHPALSLKIEGPVIGQARLPLADLADLAAGVQHALTRIGSLIQTGAISSSVSAQIKNATRLDFVGIDEGSAVLVLDFPSEIERSFPELDLGELAIEQLMQGLETVNSSDDLPDDWNDSVFHAVAELGKTLNRGHVHSISFTTHGRERARFSSTTNERVKQRLSRPLPLEYRTVVGRLMMADFDRDRRKCRIEPSDGSRVECTFPLDLLSEVRENATRFVEIEGYATEQGGRIRHLSILKLSSVRTPSGAEAEVSSKSIERLIAEQLPSYSGRSDDLVDPELWDDDNELEQFLQWVNESRNAEVL